MQDYQQEFIRFALDQAALKFGEFTLKSGRVSPYFFNAGAFCSGTALAKLARFYARAIIAADVDFDLLFGPAYKGIPLVAAVSVALAEQHGLDKPWCFNRKETKDHGEGGGTVGAPLVGRALIIDDVISAGTAVGETMQLLRVAGAEAAGVVIALDRQERGAGALSAVQELEQKYHVPVLSIVGFNELIGFVAGEPALAAHRSAVDAYRERYGV